MSNFESILDRPASEIERPKPLPQGSYDCIVQGLPRYDKSSKKQTPFIEFTLQIVGARDDVDADALEEMGGFAGKTIKNTYYDTPDAGWRLIKFIKDCGIEVEPGVNTREYIDMLPGSNVIAYITHKPSADGTTVFAQVSDTASVE